MSEYYESRRRNLIVQILTADATDPIRSVTIKDEQLGQTGYGYKRRSRPRNNWWHKALEEYWNVIKQDMEPNFRYSSFNIENPDHVRIVKEEAGKGTGTKWENGRNTQTSSTTVRSHYNMAAAASSSVEAAPATRFVQGGDHFMDTSFSYDR